MHVSGGSFEIKMCIIIQVEYIKNYRVKLLGIKNKISVKVKTNTAQHMLIPNTPHASMAKS